MADTRQLWWILAWFWLLLMPHKTTWAHFNQMTFLGQPLNHSSKFLLSFINFVRFNNLSCAHLNVKRGLKNLHMWSSKLHIWRRTSGKHLFLWSLRFRLSWLKLGLSLHTNKVRCVYFLRVCLWRRRRPFRANEPFALPPKVFQTLQPVTVMKQASAEGLNLSKTKGAAN